MISIESDYVVLSVAGRILSTHGRRQGADAEADRLAAMGTATRVALLQRRTSLVTLRHVPATAPAAPAPVFLCSTCVFNEPRDARVSTGSGPCRQYPGLSNAQARALCGGRAHSPANRAPARGGLLSRLTGAFR